MKARIASLSLLAAMTLALAAAALINQPAAAVCGTPGTPPCTGGGGGDKQKLPTPTDTRVPPATLTPTAPVMPAATASLGGSLPALNPAVSAARPGPSLSGGPLSTMDVTLNQFELACLGALGFVAFVTFGGFVFRPTRQWLGRILNGNGSTGGSGGGASGVPASAADAGDELEVPASAAHTGSGGDGVEIEHEG